MDMKSIELFNSFTDQELKNFEKAVTILEMRAGDILFREDDPGDALYIVEQGAVRIYKSIDEATGEEKSLALLEPGTYLGEMTLIDGTPRSASARAEADSLVLKISREDFLKLLQTYPQAAIRLFVSFMKVMSQRLRQTNEELVVMYEVGKIIGAAPPLPQLLHNLLEKTMSGAEAAFGIFFKVNDITNRLEVMEAIGPGFEDVLHLKTGTAEGVVGMALHSGAMLKIDNMDTDSRFEGMARCGYERKAMLIAPLMRLDEPFGAILIADPQQGAMFNSANANLLQAVAQEAAAAVEASLLHADSDAKEKMDRHYFRF